MGNRKSAWFTWTGKERLEGTEESTRRAKVFHVKRTRMPAFVSDLSPYKHQSEGTATRYASRNFGIASWLIGNSRPLVIDIA